MTKSHSNGNGSRSLSDTVIDGLFAGLAAGAVMSIVLGIAGLAIGEGPGIIFGRFSGSNIQAPLAGLLLHLAVSAIYGAVFSIFARLLPSGLGVRIPAWLAGFAYGALLLVLALGVLLPELQSPLAELPLWILALAHASYGLVLGLRAYPKW